LSITYSSDITVEAYNALLKSVNWKEQPYEQAASGLANSIVFVAEDNGTPVGVTRIVTDSGYIAIIVDVVVNPDYQGKGIGKTLTQKAVNYLKNNLPPGWSINISLMSAKGKEGFYEQFGFVNRPSERFGNGMSLFYTNSEESK